MSDAMHEALLLHTPLRVQVREGTQVVLRRVQPGDKARLREGVGRLSERSTYQRFSTPNLHLTDKELRYLTEVDGTNHVAIAALDLADEGEAGLGIARYIRLAEHPHLAEAAVAVIDARQGEGLGTLLLVALSLIAGANGIGAFQAYLVEENRAFAHHLEGLGAEAQRSTSGLLELRFPVYTDASTFPDTPAGQKHRVAYEALRAAAQS